MSKKLFTSIFALTILLTAGNIFAQRTAKLLEFFQQPYSKLDNGMLKTIIQGDESSTAVLLEETNPKDPKYKRCNLYAYIADIPSNSPHLASIEKSIAELDMTLGKVLMLKGKESISLFYTNSFWINSIKEDEFAYELIMAHYNTVDLKEAFGDYVGLE